MKLALLIRISASLLLALPLLSRGGQTVTGDYETARNDYFWPALYAAGGETIQRQIEFPKNDRSGQSA